MTKADIARLLALIAAFDRRTVGEADVEAWHLVLSHTDPEDCGEAVRQHYGRSRDWLMPVDVVLGVRRIRAQRIAAAGDPPPDADPDDPAGYRRALVEGRHAIAAPNTQARPVAALTVGQPLPRPDYGLAAQRARQHLARAAGEHAAAEPTTDAERDQRRQRRAEARAELERIRASAEPATPSRATTDPASARSDGDR
jgi:hypothetical protein